MCDTLSADYQKKPYKLGERVETKVLCGKLIGHWIPALILRVNSPKRTVDLCVLNNKGYHVAKYAIQVPYRFIRRPTYRFKVGDRIATKILRGRRQGLWIPAWIIHINEDGTYDLCVEQHRSWQVTKYAVHVPGQYLIPAHGDTLKWNTSASQEIASGVKPAQIPILSKEDLGGLNKIWDKHIKRGGKEKTSGTRSSTIDWNNQLKFSPPGFDTLTKPETLPRDMMLLEPTFSAPLFEHDMKESKVSNSQLEIPPTLSPLSVHNVSGNSGRFKQLASHKSQKQWKEQDQECGGPARVISHRRQNVSNISNWDNMYDWEEKNSAEHSRSSSTHTDWGPINPSHARTESLNMLRSSSQLFQIDSASKVSTENSSTQQKKLSPPEDSSSRPPRVEPEYEFIDSFLSGKRPRNRHDRIVTIGVSKHKVQVNEINMNTPLEEVAKWLEEGRSHKLQNSAVEYKKVNSISYNNQMIPIRSNMGASLNMKTQLPETDRINSLSDILGKSVDTSKKGLAFFVGAVNGKLSYKMSVIDVDRINRDSWHSMVEKKNLEESRVDGDHASIPSSSP